MRISGISFSYKNEFRCCSVTEKKSDSLTAVLMDLLQMGDSKHCRADCFVWNL